MKLPLAFLQYDLGLNLLISAILTIKWGIIPAIVVWIVGYIDRKRTKLYHRLSGGLLVFVFLYFVIGIHVCNTGPLCPLPEFFNSL